MSCDVASSRAGSPLAPGLPDLVRPRSGQPVHPGVRFPGLRFLGIWGVALLAVLATAPRTFAQIQALPAPTVLIEEEEEPIEVPWFLWGVSAHGDVGGVAMGSIGDAVDGVNAIIARQGTGGIKYARPTAAAAFGGGLKVVLGNRLLLWAEYERLGWASNVGGVTASSELQLPSHNLGMSVAWDFLSDPYARFGFGFGVSQWTSDAKQVFSLAQQERESLRISALGDNDVIGEIRFKGDTIGTSYFTYYELPLTERFYVTGTMGWRLAKIDKIDYEVEGGVFLSPITGEPYFLHSPYADIEYTANGGLVSASADGQDLDYSGFYGKLAFTVYWNPPDRF